MYIIHTHKQTYMDTDTDTDTHTNPIHIIYIYIYIYIDIYIYIYKYTYTHTYIHTSRARAHTPSLTLSLTHPPTHSLSHTITFKKGLGESDAVLGVSKHVPGHLELEHERCKCSLWGYTLETYLEHIRNIFGTH